MRARSRPGANASSGAIGPDAAHGSVPVARRVRRGVFVVSLAGARVVHGHEPAGAGVVASGAIAVLALLLGAVAVFAGLQGAALQLATPATARVPTVSPSATARRDIPI